MNRIPAGLLLLLTCWHNVWPMSVSKMARGYATNNLHSGYNRQNNMFGIFGGQVPCERGTCTSQQYCDQTGGQSAGYCFEPHMPARGVCCSFRESCGQTTSDSVALFRNPNYPGMNWEPVNCAFTMVPREDVCGIRVEFIQAILSTTVEKFCPQDAVTILQYSHSAAGFNMPLCGLIAGVSTVVDVRDTTKVQVVVTAQSPNALWNIRLVQINCSSVRTPAVEACGIANAVYPNMNSKENLLSSVPKSNITAPFPIFRAKQSDRVVKGTSTAGRIINGMESPNMFPWAVVLLRDSLPNCGGSLITREWVLTAGHCLILYQSPNVPDIMRFTVLLGIHNLNSLQDMPQVARQLSRIVRHPRYFGTLNDIALLRLVQPVSYSVVIRPICLPPAADETYNGRYGVIAGWGRTGNGTVVPEVLLSATVEILDNAVCNQLWSPNFHHILDSQLCTGVGSAATCEGDSGGPLAVQEQRDGFYSVVGIISFGSPGGCGTKMLPDVSTRVTSYLDWIYLVLTEA